MSWSFGASGATADEASAALDDSLAAQQEMWQASAAKAPEGRQPQDQVLDPHDEQMQQIELAVAAAKTLLPAVGEPYHINISGSGNPGHEVGGRLGNEVITVTVSSMA